MKHLTILLLLFLAGATLQAAEKITGLWKIIDDKTGKPNAIALLYEYQGSVYGRILASMDTATGQFDDSLAIKKKKAMNIQGTPAICGMDFVYRMSDSGKEWKGTIVDPEPGDEYDCVIRKDKDKLIVRGQLKGLFGFLGRDQTWLPATGSDLPGDVTAPDASTLKPVIPRHK